MQLQRVLVGFDGSDPARTALRWAGDLVARTDVELVVARVQSIDGPVDGPDALGAACRETLGTPPARAVVLHGDPSDALLQAAEDHGADLLVVGERGSGGVLHVHLGSVAHALSHRTSRPLALVPPQDDSTVGHLVVGVDGSGASLRAVEFAATLAGRLAIGITAVRATEPLETPSSGEDDTDWEERASDEVRRWIAPLCPTDVDVDVHVSAAFDPATSMERVVETHVGAISVVGASSPLGRGGPRIGRVPLHLVHHTGTAVVLVPEAGG